MAKKFLASVAEVELFEKTTSGLKHFATANTLTDSAMSFTSSMEEVRAGQGGKLYGRFNHTTGVTLQMTDILIDMNYFKAIIGADIISDTGNKLSDIIDTPIEVTFANHSGTITASDAQPVSIGNLCGSGVAAWAVAKGDCSGSADTVYALSYDSTTYTFTAFDTTMPNGTYCVSYFVRKTSGTLAQINAKFQPMELYARVRIPEFAAGSSETSDGIVGHLIFNFPRYQFDGQFDLSLAMTSNATISLNGTVLAVAGTDCSSKEYYGEIMEIPTVSSTSQDFRTGLLGIIVDPDYLTTTDIPHVWGIYSNGASLLNNDDIKAQTTTASTTFNGFSNASGSSTGVLTSDGKWAASPDGYFVVIAKSDDAAPTFTEGAWTGAKFVDTINV